MPIPGLYPELKVELDKRDLLKDEKDMWLRIGLYITTEPFWSPRLAANAVILIDGMANECHIPTGIGKNIRKQVLAWWEYERVNPRQQVKKVVSDAGGYDELENRSS